MGVDKRGNDMKNVLMYVYIEVRGIDVFVFFFNDTATTEIYTEELVGSVRCVYEADAVLLAAATHRARRVIAPTTTKNRCSLSHMHRRLYTSPSPRDRTRPRMPSSA